MTLLAAFLGFALSTSATFAAVPSPGVATGLPFLAPAGWNCAQEKTAWVCKSTRPELTQDALMVITTKTPDASDSLDTYLNMLKAPRHQNTADPELFSKPEFAQEVKIGAVSWINARHFESEIPGFTTEYFATVNHGRAYLVTLSARKGAFARAQPDLRRVVESIR